MRGSLFVFLILLNAACEMRPAKDTNPAGPIESHVRVDEADVPNKGLLLFSRPLRGLDSHEHFVLETRFLKEQGSFTLHSHFNGYAWRDGVRIRFTRDGEKLTLGVSAPDLSERTFPLESWMTQDGRLGVRIEVHNTTPAGPRILIWKSTISLQGERALPRNFISEGNADFDSHAEKLIFVTHGRGVLWGIEFDEVKLVKALGEAPYVP